MATRTQDLPDELRQICRLIGFNTQDLIPEGVPQDAARRIFRDVIRQPMPTAISVKEVAKRQPERVRHPRSGAKVGLDELTPWDNLAGLARRVQAERRWIRKGLEDLKARSEELEAFFGATVLQ